MRDVLLVLTGLFIDSLVFLGGAMLLPDRLQGHPFCE